MKKQLFRGFMGFVLCFGMIFAGMGVSWESYGASGSDGTASVAKPYLVKVNLAQNIVTVYDKDASGAYTVPVRGFYCSVGDDTPAGGTYGISDKYAWRALFGNVYGQYATRITGHILFHSVPYEKPQKDKLEYWEYNKLGTKASMGCIRLTVKDAKWIYDYCASGTKVTFFSSDAPEPITPEKPAIIGENDPKRGWDPTDPDMYNPWQTSGLWVNGVWRPYRMAKVIKDGTVMELDGIDVNGHYYMFWERLHAVFPEASAPPANAAMEDYFYKFRDVAELLGYQVGWDNAAQMISLS